MSWSELGTLTLGYDWQTFNLPSIASETFRLSMPGVDAVTGYCLIRPFYASSGAGAARRAYPTNEQKVLTFLIPPELKQQSQSVRYFQAKLSYRVRILAGQSWQLKLEEFS